MARRLASTIAASEYRNTFLKAELGGWQPEHATAPTGGSEGSAAAAVKNNRTAAAGKKWEASSWTVFNSAPLRGHAN